MTTAAAMLAQTRRRVDGDHRPARNTLAAAVASAAATTITLSLDAPQIGEGTPLSVGLEVMIVESYVPATRVVTVARGQDGSTAATHALGAQVLIRPRFTDFDLFQALNDEIVSLSGPNFFQVKTLDRTITSGIYGYDLATDVIDVESIAYESLSGTQRWPTISRRFWRVDHQLATSEFASGKALFLQHAPPVGRSMRVVYKARFGRMTALADVVETVTGLPVTAHDIPPVGVAIAIGALREIPHNDPLSQGQPRRADEVPAGAILNSVRGAIAYKQQRLREEKNSLRQLYPLRVA